MNNKRIIVVLLAIVILVILGITMSACGSNKSPGASDVNNTRVCAHFRAQQHWKQNLVYPTMADVAKVMIYTAADDAEATPGSKLRRDLDQMLLDMQGKPNHYKNGTVSADCGI